MQKENVISFPENAKEVFGIIDEQLFVEQFNSQTSDELDKMFIYKITTDDMAQHEKSNLFLAFVNLKKLLVCVSTGKEPKRIKKIKIDTSFYF